MIAPSLAGVFAPLAGLWYRVGWAGVDLFFVLSGFLVSGLLFAEFKRAGRVNVGRFLVRRSFKICPAYFAYLAMVGTWIGLQQWRGVSGADVANLWPNLLQVQNYFGTPRIHTWSLAVEEHFYLAGAGLAAFVLVQARIGYLRKFFPMIAIAGLVAVAWVRHSGFASAGRGSLNLLATHLRFDGLLVGSLVAYFSHFKPSRLLVATRFPLLCVVAGFIMAAPTLLLTPDHSALSAGAGLGIMYLGFALIMLGVLGLERRVGWQNVFAATPVRGIAGIGLFSYGIYLWHIDLAQVPMKKTGALALAAGIPESVTWLAITMAYVALAAGAGALMSRLIEMPFLALRDRWYPSKAPTVGPVLSTVAAPDRPDPAPAITGALKTSWAR